jgi:hypothetical protein
MQVLEDRCVPSTLTVRNTLDSGAGSLRAEIAAAHNGDTIQFAMPTTDPGYNPTTGVFTITLTSGELVIKQNLTISGPGASALTVSGANASRVFELSSKTKPQVTLSGLTISNGYAPGPFGPSANNGGGILNEGTLTVSNCTIAYNSAPEGAGILNDAGATLTVSNSTLAYNTGRDSGGYQSSGGAIDNFGTLFIHGSTLSYNSAGGGGAISTAIGSVTIDAQTVLSHNTATRGGGGAIAGSVGLTRAVTLNDCTLSDNSAGFNGGAVTFGGTTLTLNRCTLAGNSASSRGGALYVGAGTSLGVSVTVSGCTLTGNSAQYGGGIDIEPGATVSLDAFTVANIIDNTDSSGLNGPTANIHGSYTLI